MGQERGRPLKGCLFSTTSSLKIQGAAIWSAPFVCVIDEREFGDVDRGLHHFT